MSWRISRTDFVRREIDFLAERFAGHKNLPSIGLTDDAGRTWTTGGAEGDPARRERPRRGPRSAGSRAGATAPP